MNTQAGTRITREYCMEINAEAKEIFPLLCPVREYDWIPHWRCRMLYSASGFAELGCVFQTELDDRYGTETWLVICHEKDRKIAFVRTGPRRVTYYEITLTPSKKGTRLIWSQVITGLDSKGCELISAESPSEFAATMHNLEGLLVQYLKC